MSEIKEELIETGIWKRADRLIVRLSGREVGSYSSIAAARMALKGAKLSVDTPRAGGLQRKLQDEKGFGVKQQQWLNRGWS